MPNELGYLVRLYNYLEQVGKTNLSGGVAASYILTFIYVALLRLSALREFGSLRPNFLIYRLLDFLGVMGTGFAVFTPYKLEQIVIVYTT